MFAGMPQLPNPPRGYFTRTVRKLIEPIWAAEYAKLGSQCDRWHCRVQAWPQALQQIGIGNIMYWIWEGYKKCEQKVLTDNQTALTEAFKSLREEDPQFSIPTLGQNKLHARLKKIRTKFVREPGVDHKFGSLVPIYDLSWETLQRMAEVREDGIDKALLSLEDYMYMEKVRLALSLPKQTTLGQAFNF